MIKIETLYFFVICYFSNVTISVDVSQKYEHINNLDIPWPSELYRDSEATVDFICGELDKENDIFSDEPLYIGRYLKTRIGSVNFINCQFHDIQRNYFKEFEFLHTFNISHLELETLQIKSFKGAKKLTNLIASKNRLTKIPAHLFSDAMKLDNIDFSYNIIQHIDPLAFEGAVQLKKLNLSQNQINQMDLQSIFLPNLTVLDLSFNSFGILNTVTFKNLSNLEHLSLREANITSIKLGAFSYNQKLISLDLSGNHLKNVNFNLFFPTLANLRSLSLNHNELTELHCIQISMLSEFVILDLNNNRFNCSYLKHFMDLVNWEKLHRPLATASSNTQQGNIGGITCEPLSSNDSSQADNKFMIEVCPVTNTFDNYKTDKTEEAADRSIILLILFFVCIITLTALCIYLFLKRYQLRAVESCAASERKSTSVEFGKYANQKEVWN